MQTMRVNRHILLLECGHWGYESAPDDFDPAAPANRVRVCSALFAGQHVSHSARYPLTVQGFPLVPVTHVVSDPRDHNRAHAGERNAEMRMALAYARWAVETVGYWVRPYDMLADRRRWFWHRRVPCAAYQITDSGVIVRLDRDITQAEADLIRATLARRAKSSAT